MHAHMFPPMTADVYPIYHNPYPQMEEDEPKISSPPVYELDDSDWFVSLRGSVDASALDIMCADYPLPDYGITLGLDDRWGRPDYHLTPEQLQELEASIRNVNEFRDARKREKAVAEQLERVERILEEAQEPPCAATVPVPQEEKHQQEDIESRALKRKARLANFLRTALRKADDDEKEKPSADKRRSNGSGKSLDKSSSRRLIPSSSRPHSNGSAKTSPTSPSSSGSQSTPKSGLFWGADGAVGRRLEQVLDLLAAMGPRPGSPALSDVSFVCEHAKAIERGERSALRQPPNFF